MYINDAKKQNNVSFSITRLITTIGIPAIIASLMIIVCNLSYFDTQNHFFYLAQSFLSGKTYFLQDISTIWFDVSPYLGKLYLPMGPLPAFLLMPFAALSPHSPLLGIQGVMNLLAAISSASLCYSITKKIGYTVASAAVLTSAFVFSSPFFGIAATPKSWYFAHSIVTLLILVSIYEYQTKRRWWIIGSAFCLILATRTLAAIGIMFFLITIIHESNLWTKIKATTIGAIKKLTSTYAKFSGINDGPSKDPVPALPPEWNVSKTFKRILALLAPLLIGGIALASYNYARFGSILEQGYTYQNVDLFGKANRDAGLFSIRHVPANLYYLLIATPQPVFSSPTSHIAMFPYLKPSPWGMSIFITSPYLALLFISKRKERETKLLLAISLLTLIPILFYYGIGFSQFGYRYALDFFPFLFLAFLIEYKKRSQANAQHEFDISTGLKRLISCSIALNIVFVLMLI